VCDRIAAAMSWSVCYGHTWSVESVSHGNVDICKCGLEHANRQNLRGDRASTSMYSVGQLVPV
jgi:hypothetical protein